MAKDITKQFVNWSDGMQVSKDHFISLEDAVINRFVDTRGSLLTSFNYGLLPAISSSGDGSLEVNLKQVSGTNISIELIACKCITSGGYRIDINRGLTNKATEWQSFVYHFDLKTDLSNSYYIVLGVKPFERVPVGEPSSDESFHRHPFTIPNYHLAIIPEDNINAGESQNNYIPISRFSFDNGSLVEDASYIPPCMAMCSHWALDDIFRKLRVLVDQILKDAINIRKRVNQQLKNPRSKAKERDFNLATNVGGLARQVCQYIS